MTIELKNTEINTEQTTSSPVTINFCHQAGSKYEELLEECMGDPRSVAGIFALRMSGPNAERGYIPSFDSREALDKPQRRING